MQVENFVSASLNSGFLSRDRGPVAPVAAVGVGPRPACEPVVAAALAVALVVAAAFALEELLFEELPQAATNRQAAISAATIATAPARCGWTDTRLEA
jgi:hypothetical protein